MPIKKNQIFTVLLSAVIYIKNDRISLVRINLKHLLAGCLPSGLCVGLSSSCSGPMKLSVPLDQKNLHPVCPELEKGVSG